MSNIILCGFMGSGKTTIGKMLAKKLDMPFVDTDEYIENKLNMTTAIRIGNLVTELHQVLNAYYQRPIDKKKAIVKMVTKIYEAGVNDSKNN